MTTRLISRVIVGALGLTLVLACGEDQSTDPQLTGTSAKIVEADTTLLVGEDASFRIEVQYIFGPGAPANVLWSVGDTSLLDLETTHTDPVTLQLVSDGSATITGKKAGATVLAAFVNKKFYDTITVTVAALGAVRWRHDLAGDIRLNAPAVDDSGNVYVTNAGSGSATLMAFTPGGATRYSAASCASALSPSVDPIGNAWSTGAGCTKNHAPTGAVTWSSTLGTGGGGVAVSATSEVFVLHAAGTAGAGAVALSRFGADGSEKWRDTLRPVYVAQTSAPALATNGDIYILWQAPSDSNWLSRVSASGAVRWTVAIPTASGLVTPALLPNRIYVSRQGGLIVFDSTGAIVWSRQFHDANAAASLTEPASSPAVDGVGSVYVQTAGALYSYGADGTLAWFADSLGAGSGATAVTGVGAPSILVSLSLVVPCKGEVCVVGTSDGSLKSRSALGGGVAGAIGVGPDGTMYATRTKSAGLAEIVALWGRALPVEAGWPTEGHDMTRSRRQP